MNCSSSFSSLHSSNRSNRGAPLDLSSSSRRPSAAAISSSENASIGDVDMSLKGAFVRSTSVAVGAICVNSLSTSFMTDWQSTSSCPPPPYAAVRSYRQQHVHSVNLAQQRGTPQGAQIEFHQRGVEHLGSNWFLCFSIQKVCQGLSAKRRNKRSTS